MFETQTDCRSSRSLDATSGDSTSGEPRMMLLYVILLQVMPLHLMLLQKPRCYLRSYSRCYPSCYLRWTHRPALFLLLALDSLEMWNDPYDLDESDSDSTLLASQRALCGFMWLLEASCMIQVVSFCILLYPLLSSCSSCNSLWLLVNPSFGSPLCLLVASADLHTQPFHIDELSHLLI